MRKRKQRKRNITKKRKRNIIHIMQAGEGLGERDERPDRPEAAADPQQPQQPDMAVEFYGGP